MKSIAMQPQLKLQSALTINRSYNVQKTGFQTQFVGTKFKYPTLKNLAICEPNIPNSNA